MPVRILRTRPSRARAAALAIAVALGSSTLVAAQVADAEDQTSKVVGTPGVDKPVDAATPAEHAPADMRPVPKPTIALTAEEIAARFASAAQKVQTASARRDAAQAARTAIQQDAAKARSFADLARLAAAMLRNEPVAAPETNAAERELADAQAALDQAKIAADRLTAEYAAFTNLAAVIDALPGGPGEPIAVVGRSALSPEQLAAWFTGRWGITTTKLGPVIDLARAYIDIGNQLNVRGDIAFIQASHETGQFSSGHATQRFNMAGIGAFASCVPSCGVRYPSLDAGIRGHLELVHDFALASPTLSSFTSKGIAGCCTTWMALGRTWASGPTYSENVLGQYRDAVRRALGEFRLTDDWS